MGTFLLTWNPRRQYDWKDLPRLAKRLEDGKTARFNWSCGNSVSIRKGDRLFMLRQGLEPKGIVASGFATSGWYEDKHWDGRRGTTHYVDILFDAIRDPAKRHVLPRELLGHGKLARVHWDTQQSGIRIPDDVGEELEKAWASLLGRKFVAKAPYGEDAAVAGGAGFGADAEKNRKAEIVAVKFVRREFERRGWSIADVQKDNLGYDLACTRRGETQHVEVKGVSGADHKFILTSNEKRCLDSDESFVLAIVTNALLKNRKLATFTADEVRRSFTFNALSFMVERRGER